GAAATVSAAGGDQLTLSNSSSVSIAGSGTSVAGVSGETIDVNSGTNDSITLSGVHNTINTAAGTFSTINISGSVDTLDLAADSAKIVIAAGLTSESISGAHENITLDGNDVLSLSDIDDTVNLIGSGNRITANDARIDVSGEDELVYTSGTGDV